VSLRLYAIQTRDGGPGYLAVGRDRYEAMLALPPRFGKPRWVIQWTGPLTEDLAASVPFNRLGHSFRLTLSEMGSRGMLDLSK
jgi:hypothetical protein